MIQLKYAALFDIELLHDYYVDGKCRDIRLIPTSSCDLLMRQLGLRFIQTETGCKVFTRVAESASGDLIKTTIPENTKLCFQLVQQHPAFQTITEVDLTKNANTFYYFNNLVNNPDAGNTPLLVTDTVTKKLSNKDLFRFERKTYQKSITQNGDQKTGEIRLADTTEVIKSILGSNKGKFDFSFNLQAVNSGRAGFFVEGVEQDKFYIRDADDGNAVFGVVEIFHRSSLPDAYRFIDADKSVHLKNYKIKFANRQTTWRYVVNKKFNQQVTGVNINKTNGTTINFLKKAGTPVDQFILFSTNPIPLKQETLTGIRMTDQNDKEIIAHLPNASATLLKAEGNELFSDIFITI